ncbi:UNVERIFIED_CONTAM: hypothetical protein PYX00_003343 [Menopon gallinae]|uniref:GRIP domain-containing protein n=1 Tax=Menopon gallinae TaxID=328185 RepID=A0AAW2HZN0_9NEOP
MDTNPKKLLERIEQQEKQLLVYQNKLRDTVQAYKSIAKEKEALEKTIKTFTTDLSNEKVVKETSEKSSEDETSEDQADLKQQMVEKYEKTVTSLTNELEATKRRLELSERKLKETPLELLKLQDEMRNLQIEHQTALQAEKERVRNVEERAKKMSTLQEERVVNLETQLVELSQTIGSYDRLRVQDQLEIQKLKELIALGSIDSAIPGAVDNEPEKVDSSGSEDVDCLIQKILDLKLKLNSACEKYGRKIDFHKIFDEGYSDSNLHAGCVEAYNKLRTEYELLKNDVKLYGSQEKSDKEIVLLQNQVKNLQERLRILTDKNGEIQKDYQMQIDQLKSSMKNEKARLKETLAATESDYRGRLWLLEEQLQKQRERSLALIEEKEQEIQTLHNTFHVFMPEYRKKSEDESANSSGLGISQVRDGPHILHYANELARRDIEIANLRKSKHKSESELRELQKTSAAEAERHRDERQALRDEIGRLKLCQTREGANLEYLKNVVLSFLLSNDAKSKRHMCNAIAAVLKFNESELARVRDHSRNSWWSHSGYL